MPRGKTDAPLRVRADAAAELVGRDSPRAATRVNQPQCADSIPKRGGAFAKAQHCGGVSEWDVLSGGHMGQVMGEDSPSLAIVILRVESKGAEVMCLRAVVNAMF